jgi:hypothetical protein
MLQRFEVRTALVHVGQLRHAANLLMPFLVGGDEIQWVNSPGLTTVPCLRHCECEGR